MPDSATIIRDGDDIHRLQISHRDWMLICGPGFVEGQAFIAAFGIFKHFKVAGGIPKDSIVQRDGQTLFDASTTLLAGIERDFELLSYDYACRVGGQPKQFGGGRSISVGGRPGILSLRPKGYCSIKYVDGSPSDLIDLRVHNGMVTDAGPVKVYRRKVETHWLGILPLLLAFLGPRQTKTLSLQHIDRVG